MTIEITDLSVFPFVSLQEALIHGRVYVSLNYLCFYANIFKWETRVVVKCKDIASLTKTNTAKLIPNAIQVTTNDGDRHTLTSFIARDKSYVMMFRVWQNALLDQPMSSSDLWSWVHFSYGEDLGFSSDEEEELKGDFANEFKHVRKSDASGSTSSDESKTDQAVEKSIRRATKRMSSNVDAIHENEIDEEDDDDEDDGDGDDEEEPDSLTLLQAVECPCSEHQGRTLADKTFPIPVDAVFTLLFSESKFYKNMQAEREAINLVFEPWQEISPSENGASKKRVLRFTVMSPHPMVKSAPTIETQFLQEYRPGELYTVMSECVSKDVPYCDSFFVRTKYCLTRGRQENETRLLIHAEVIITGNSWSFRLARGLVEKSAFGGVTDFINDLIAALNKYCNEGPSIISDITGAVELENIRRPSLTSKTDSLRSRESLRKILEVVNRPQLPESTARRLSQSRSRTSSLQALLNAPEEYISIRVIIGIVVFLFLIIIFLYVQVWNLEKAADAYERLLKSSLASNAGHLTHPSHYQSVQGLRKILAKAIEMAQMIERNLQDLESDLEEFTPTF